MSVLDYCCTGHYFFSPQILRATQSGVTVCFWDIGGYRGGDHPSWALFSWCYVIIDVPQADWGLSLWGLAVDKGLVCFLDVFFSSFFLPFSETSCSEMMLFSCAILFVRRRRVVVVFIAALLRVAAYWGGMRLP